MHGLPQVRDPNLLVGTETSDDASVYRLTDETALVQTVDVFTPVVDHPYTFGQIVAANCLSDIWAMGGKVLTALNLLGFPPHKMDADTAAEILKGCAEKAHEAGAVISGGHTWVDPELRAGLAVSGIIHPRRIVTNAGARPGDALLLTKPIGGGIVTFAAIRNAAGDSLLDPVVESMITLNNTASEAMLQSGANACTDITGFSLLGHAAGMAVASSVTMEIQVSGIPVFSGALDLAAQGIILPLGTKNESSFREHILYDGEPSPAMKSVLFDPQTSGGLLISIEMSKAPRLLDILKKGGSASASIIGRVTDSQAGKIRVIS